MRRLSVTREGTGLACQTSSKEGNNTIQRKRCCGNNSGLSCSDYKMDSIQEIKFFNTKKKGTFEIIQTKIKWQIKYKNFGSTNDFDKHSIVQGRRGWDWHSGSQIPKKVVAYFQSNRRNNTTQMLPEINLELITFNITLNYVLQYVSRNYRTDLFHIRYRTAVLILRYCRVIYLLLLTVFHTNFHFTECYDRRFT